MTSVHFGSVGTRGLEHHVDGAGLAVDVRREVIADGADFHLGHVAQAQQVAAVACTQHDVVELLNRFQRTLVFHRILVGILRLLAQGTRSCYETLTADGCEHVVGLQSVLSHHVGLQPDAQGVGVLVTSAGSSAVARLTRFCTLTAAMSGSVPCSKYTWMLTSPEAEAELVM